MRYISVGVDELNIPFLPDWVDSERPPDWDGKARRGIGSDQDFRLVSCRSLASCDLFGFGLLGLGAILLHVALNERGEQSHQ